MPPNTITLEPVTVWKQKDATNWTWTVGDPDTRPPDLEEVTREIVEAVLAHSKVFDWREHSGIVAHILYVYQIQIERNLIAEHRGAWMESGALLALQEAKKALTFDMLNDRPMPKGAFGHFQKVISGYCVHRAQMILSKMIQGIGGR